MPLKSLLLWLGAGTIAAVLVAWVAAQVHASGHAPVGLVSAGTGVLLGVVLSWLAVALGIHCRWRLAIGALLLAMVAVFAEHAWLYRDFRGQWQAAREKSAAVAMFRSETPPSAAEYFAHEWNPALWLVDGVIIVGTTVGTVLSGGRGGKGVGLEADANGVNSPH